MRVFVTGGTGFIGSRLVRRLVKQGHEVRALARSDASADLAEKLGAQAVRGDLGNLEALREGMQGCDAVFHIAAWYRLGVYDVEKMERINVEGTRNVLGLAHELGVPKIIYTSSVAVHGDTQGEVVDESYRADGPFHTVYDRTKWAAHYEVAHPLIEQGAPIIILMPGAVYGPGDESLVGQLMRAFYRGLMPVIPGPGTTLTYVHVDDVVEGHLLALEQGKVGESYHLVGQVTSLAEIFQLWAELLGRRVPPIAIPGSLAQPFVPLLKTVGTVIPLPSLINHEAVAILGSTYAARSDKAQAELGWTPRPLREGMTETLIQMASTTPRVPGKRRWMHMGLGALLLGLGLLILWLIRRSRLQGE